MIPQTKHDYTVAGSQVYSFYPTLFPVNVSYTDVCNKDFILMTIFFWLHPKLLTAVLNSQYNVRTTF